MDFKYQMFKKIKTQEREFIDGLHSICVKYVRLHPDYRYEETYENHNKARLEEYMASMYKAATDPTICEALNIVPGKSTPKVVEAAMCCWLRVYRGCEHKVNEEGLHLFFANLTGDKPNWYPLPFTFVEKWRDHGIILDLSREAYMSNFITGNYVRLDQ